MEGTEMKRNHMILLVLVVVGVFWYVSGRFFDIFFGINFPIIGPIGIEPFAFLREYGVLIGGVFAVFLFVMIQQRRKQTK